MPRIKVLALPMGGPYISVDADAPTDERGEFEFTRLAPTRYTLLVGEAQLVGEVTAVAGQQEAVTVPVRKRP